MEKFPQISFFIEIYPIVRRLSLEDEYPFPDGVIKITDGLINKFIAGKAVTDVKEFREIRRALSYWDRKNDLGEFKKRFDAFLKSSEADLSPFTVALEDERNVAALLKYAAIVSSILDNSGADSFSETFVVEQLKQLSKKIKNVLEELE